MVLVNLQACILVLEVRCSLLSRSCLGGSARPASPVDALHTDVRDPCQALGHALHTPGPVTSSRQGASRPGHGERVHEPLPLRPARRAPLAPPRRRPTSSRPARPCFGTRSPLSTPGTSRAPTSGTWPSTGSSPRCGTGGPPSPVLRGFWGRPDHAGLCLNRPPGPWQPCTAVGQHQRHRSVAPRRPQCVLRGAPHAALSSNCVQMTGTGFGDVSPKNIVEQVLANINMIIGVVSERPSGAATLPACGAALRTTAPSCGSWPLLQRCKQSGRSVPRASHAAARVCEAEGSVCARAPLPRLHPAARSSCLACW